MFCANISIIAAPLTKLTGKNIPFEWGQEQKDAQEKLITLITNAPVLVKPDPSHQFELETDASQIGTGAILYQCNCRGRSPRHLETKSKPPQAPQEPLLN